MKSFNMTFIVIQYKEGVSRLKLQYLVKNIEAEKNEQKNRRKLTEIFP